MNPVETIKTIKKWVTYLPFFQWQNRYYKIDGAFFYYSKEKNWETKGCAFLGISKIEEKSDYLMLSTGSKIWYLKGDNPDQTREFKTLIDQGISKGKDILKKKYKKNEEIIPSDIDDEEVSLNILDLSNSSITSSKISNDFKVVLKDLETKLKIENKSLNDFIQDNNYGIDELKELFSRYEKIYNGLNKVNKDLKNYK